MKSRAYYQAWAKITAKAIIEFYGLPKLPVRIDAGGWTSFEWNEGRGAIALNFDLDELERAYNTKKDNWQRRFGAKYTSLKAFLLQVILHEIKHYSDFLELGAIVYAERHEAERYTEHDARAFEIGADNFARVHYPEANFFIKEVLRGGD